MFSAFNTFLRSSGQPQCSARGPTPDFEPVPQSRVLNGDTPNLQLETGAPGENLRGFSMWMGPHRKVLPLMGIEPRTHSATDNVTITVQKIEKKKYYMS